MSAGDIANTTVLMGWKYHYSWNFMLQTQNEWKSEMSQCYNTKYKHCQNTDCSIILGLDHSVSESLRKLVDQNKLLQMIIMMMIILIMIMTTAAAIIEANKQTGRTVEQ